MRRRSILLLLLWPTIATGQVVSQVTDTRPTGTSRFVARWEDVPAPTKAVTQRQTYSGVWPTPWSGWRWESAPGGQLEVSNAQVDRNQQVGAWSQPAVVKAKSGWELIGDCNNLPNDPRAAGVIWRVIQNGKTCYYGNGSHVPVNFQSYSLNSHNAQPKPAVLIPFGDGSGHHPFRSGGLLNDVAAPPNVNSTGVPDVNLEACITWVTNNGETIPGPVGVLPKSTDPRVRPGGVNRRELQLGSWWVGMEKVPWGALGYHLYVRRQGGPWHRQPSRRCGETPTLDEYLWQPNNNRPMLTTFRENTPGPQPSARPQSFLSAAQVELKYTRGDRTITDAQTIYCPFVDEYEGRVGPADDPARLPYVGSESHLKFAPNRTITFTAGATVTPGGMAPGCSHATFYPALLVEGRSKWVGMHVNAQGKGVRNCSAGVQFRDYSGGQSMGCKFQGCSFALRSDDPAWQTKGIEVAWECEGVQGHTASELEFADCTLTACVCVWLEHNQTANVRFTGRTFASSFVNDRRCPCLWIDAPAEFNFEGALYCQSGGTVFSLGWSPTVNVERIFVDQPFVSLVDCNNHQPGRITFTKGKINAFTPDGRNAPNLFRVFNSTSEFPIRLEGVTVQPNTAEGLAAVHPCPHRAKILAERSNVLDLLTLHEPSIEQFDAVSNWKNTEKEPGVRIEIPPRSVLNAKGESLGEVRGVTLVFNSLTGATQKVRRQPWTLSR